MPVKTPAGAAKPAATATAATPATPSTAATPATAAGATSDKPGKPKREKKPKVPRTEWGTRDAEGKLTTPIKDRHAIEGYDSKKHLPLRKCDFENPSDHMEWQDDRLEAKVASLRKRAKDERGLGTAAERQKAKKLRKLHEQFAALSQEMKDSGLDVEKLLAD